jgi:predicted dehydrogenase
MRIKFSVIGLNHGHIYSQTEAVLRGGGELVSFFAIEPDLSEQFSKAFPQAKQVQSVEEILEDESINLVVSASIPNERSPLGMQVMQHGKDFMSDKPGFTTLEQLADVRRVQAETKQIYSILYSERLDHPATIRAGELVKAGVIGKVVQTVNLAPHSLGNYLRPDWFYSRQKQGGIIADIGSHQIDQFLFFTDSTSAEIVSASVANYTQPQHTEFEDFGEVLLKSNNGTGYVRIDWLSPNALGTWGDGRLTILGTEGYIEVRKNCDLQHDKRGNHLYLVNQTENYYLDCNDVICPYGEQLVDDILNRTETAMSQEHCFLVSELALKAQKQAQKI